MQQSKGVTIFSYILIGIVLLPIFLVLLYVVFGVALFLVLYIINRVKGKIDSKEGKNYKIASTIVIVIGAAIMVFGFKVNFYLVPNWDFSNLNWTGYFYLQLLIFIGLIPMDIFLIKKLKK